jgi:hypothetical protein
MLPFFGSHKPYGTHQCKNIFISNSDCQQCEYPAVLLKDVTTEIFTGRKYYIPTDYYRQKACLRVIFSNTALVAIPSL